VGEEGAQARPAPLLTVDHLTSRFYLRDGVVNAVEDVSFAIAKGESVGIVGESGSGKTATLMSLLRLLPSPGRIVSGRVDLDGADILTLPDEELRRIRGNKMAYVPQNPMAALNPLFKIEWQLREALSSHGNVPKAEAQRRIAEALTLAGIADARSQMFRYPHEFSGGMRQRVLIAMAILNTPALLLADEPTTALDTTMQAKVLDLLRGLVERFGMALLLITHNMGVVAAICERVLVMYAGEVVETGAVGDLFRAPLHPYSRQLLQATPRLGERRARLEEPDTVVPSPTAKRIGCAFRSRCPSAEEQCLNHPELLEVGAGRSVRCWVAQRELGVERT
jgi:oligopeptide/dipeptide ABC transporter ATP-binding protein